MMYSVTMTITMMAKFVLRSIAEKVGGSGREDGLVREGRLGREGRVHGGWDDEEDEIEGEIGGGGGEGQWVCVERQ